MTTAVELPRAIVVALAVCVACAGPTPGAPPLETEYHVAPPDVLAITVRPEPGVPRQVTVRPDGRISLDLIGELWVEGRTVPEIREEVDTRIREFVLSPDVTVELIQSNSRQFFMFGQVNRVGAFPLVGRVTAIEALAQAGGPTGLADLNDALLVRRTPEGSDVYPIRYGDILKRGNPATDHELQPGDIIRVPPGISGVIGFAVGAILFPIQQLIGLGGRFIPGV